MISVLFTVCLQLSLKVTKKTKSGKLLYTYSYLENMSSTIPIKKYQKAYYDLSGTENLRKLTDLKQDRI